MCVFVASFVPPRRTASNLHLIQRGISCNVTRVLATIERHIMTETHAARPQEPASCRSSPVTGQQPLATRSLAVRFLAAHKPLASLSLSLCSLSLSAQAPPLPLRSHASCDRCCHPSNSQPSSPFVSSSRSLHRSLFARQPPAVRCFVRQPLASYTPTACLPSRSPAARLGIVVNC